MLPVLASILGALISSFAPAVPVAGAARTGPTIGVADQTPVSFDSPYFQALHVRRTRYVTAWNSIDKDRARLDQWLQAARSHGLEPIVALSASAGSKCPKSPCKLPSRTAYTRAFVRFHKAYPWVKLIQPWNEVNNPTQPTYKHPEAAARYYEIVRSHCHGCTIPGADVQDLNNLKSWVKSFLRHVKHRPKLWGLHNYSDVNRFHPTGTSTALRVLPGKIWITESGGLTSFVGSSGNVAFRPNPIRAAKATEFLIKLALAHRTRIARIYIYQFSSDAKNRFDAGLVTPAGKPRPAYDVIRRYSRYIR